MHARSKADVQNLNYMLSFANIPNLTKCVHLSYY